ncbi:MAG: LUD domain-containing protein [Alphaproteobacteria bacterium]|nr:LUD domain-containing protein [Alphaproteobacteria bacterium]
MSAREDMLSRIRGAVGKGRAADAGHTVDARLAAHRMNLIPARGQLAPDAKIKLFETMAREASATLTRVPLPSDVPEAIAQFLKSENLPSRVAMAPDPWLGSLGWERQPLLAIRRGRAEPSDEVGVTVAFSAIAETGTLMLLSGPDTPTTLNLLPETHIVVLRESQVVGAYEEAWARLREARVGEGGAVAMPRTVNFITGPSRSADIEQQLQMGAHGPRRLHIVLVEG